MFGTRKFGEHRFGIPPFGIGRFGATSGSGKIPGASSILFTGSDGVDTTSTVSPTVGAVFTEHPGGGPNGRNAVGVWEKAENLCSENVSNGIIEVHGTAAVTSDGTSEVEPLEGLYTRKSVKADTSTHRFFSQGFAFTGLEGQTIRFKVPVWIPSSFTGTVVRLSHDNTFSGVTSTVFASADLGLRDQWQLMSGTFTLATDVTGTVHLHGVNSTVGEVLYTCGWDVGVDLGFNDPWKLGATTRAAGKLPYATLLPSGAWTVAVLDEQSEAGNTYATNRRLLTVMQDADADWAFLAEVVESDDGTNPNKLRIALNGASGVTETFLDTRSWAEWMTSVFGWDGSQAYTFTGGPNGTDIGTVSPNGAITFGGTVYFGSSETPDQQWNGLFSNYASVDPGLTYNQAEALYRNLRWWNDEIYQ